MACQKILTPSSLSFKIEFLCEISDCHRLFGEGEFEKQDFFERTNIDL